MKVVADGEGIINPGTTISRNSRRASRLGARPRSVGMRLPWDGTVSFDLFCGSDERRTRFPLTLGLQQETLLLPLLLLLLLLQIFGLIQSEQHPRLQTEATLLLLLWIPFLVRLRDRGREDGNLALLRVETLAEELGCRCFRGMGGGSQRRSDRGRDVLQGDVAGEQKQKNPRRGESRQAHSCRKFKSSIWNETYPTCRFPPSLTMASRSACFCLLLCSLACSSRSSSSPPSDSFPACSYTSAASAKRSSSR